MCKYVSYSRQKSKSITPDKINNFELQILSTVRDLGVMLSFDLTFNVHIDAIANFY